MPAKIIGAASSKHREQIERLANFLELESVEYTDLGTGEDYILFKGGSSVILKVRSNKDQGGFLSIVDRGRTAGGRSVL